jgi:Uma2 family endonuclease
MNTLPRIPVEELPCSLIVDPPMTDAEFLAFCLANDGAQVERTSEGVIRMNPPTGPGTTFANSEINFRLFGWWSTHKRGAVVADSSGGFNLPDGSVLSPDAAYIQPETNAKIARRNRRGFFPVCPDFVIELLSPSDTLKKTQAKMESWIANGVKLGWLIDPKRKRVFVYQPKLKARIFTGNALKGTGPVNGFNLDLVRIWRCYEE